MSKCKCNGSCPSRKSTSFLSSMITTQGTEDVEDIISEEVKIPDPDEKIAQAAIEENEVEEDDTNPSCEN